MAQIPPLEVASCSPKVVALNILFPTPYPCLHFQYDSLPFLDPCSILSVAVTQVQRDHANFFGVIMYY